MSNYIYSVKGAPGNEVLRIIYLSNMWFKVDKENEITVKPLI